MNELIVDLVFEFTWPDGHQERALDSNIKDISAILATGATITKIFLYGFEIASWEKG